MDQLSLKPRIFV